MSLDLSELFRRRLLMVVGKGGVGKTTVATALAIEASRAGRRTLLVEVDGVGRAGQLFGVTIETPGEAHAVAPDLNVMTIEGKAALAEYLTMIVPVKRVIRTVLESRVYQYFVAAAPGLKELMTIGKIWYESDRTVENTGELLWDVVVVDAPATGHSLQYLGMPQAAVDAFGAGLVRREAQRIIDLLQDPEKTGVVFVTTAEEMPVNETVEMYRWVCDELHLPASGLVVNRMHEAGVRADDVRQLRDALGRAKRSTGGFPREVLKRAVEESGWIEINARYLERLRQEISLPRMPLPFLFSEEFGLAEIKKLGALLREASGEVGLREAAT